jgi:GNAT superfamily N-acetyltransferase
MTTVRDATPEDADAIALVHTNSWRVGYAGIVPDGFLDAMDVEAWANRHRNTLRSPPRRTQTFVAQSSGVVIGFARTGAYRNPDGSADRDAGEVNAIYVDPAHWSTGAGAALMSASINGLTGEGFLEIRLWTLEANARARGFYERWGFVLDGQTEAHTIGAGSEFESSPKTVRYTRTLHPPVPPC